MVEVVFPERKGGQLLAEDPFLRPRYDLRPLFAPRAVAVIGASARPESVGHAVFRNLLMSHFTGVIYPVNPKRKAILGVRCYPSILEVDDTLDLAVIIIPAPAVPQALRECGQRGIRHAIIISAGFKEVGGEGVRLEEEVKRVAQEYGIAVMGPNCLGLINTDPAVSMNASFARTTPRSGNISFISQSGALCTAVLDYAKGEDIGFAKFISFGNKAGVDESDLLLYLGDDPQTDVILMYVEEISDGQRFMRIARYITGDRPHPKPILAIKTGRTLEGAKAAASHTGSLVGSDEVYDALFAQSGILRVETVEDLFHYAVAFANQPLPQGRRVAIITNAGGPGIMATDACVRYKLEVARFQPETEERLRAALPPTAAVHNPVDVIGDAQHDRYEAALRTALADPNVDAGIVILTPQQMTDIEEIARTVVRVSKEFPKPVIAAFMGLYDVSRGVQILQEGGVPHYPFPEAAARVLAALASYRWWLERPRTEERYFPVERERALRVIQKAREEGRRYLPELEALEVLEAYGFPLLASRLAQSEEEAALIAAEMGYPVVLKIAGPEILHKTDIGGVVVGLHSEEELRRAYRGIMERALAHYPPSALWGVVVQEMAHPGREVILGGHRDPNFGPLIMFGLGGIYTEVFRDVSFRLAPIRELSAFRMIQSIRAYPILEGVRGERRADLSAIAECLERLSQLICDMEEIGEIDINPLIVYAEGRGAVVADARIVLIPERPNCEKQAPFGVKEG